MAEGNHAAGDAASTKLVSEEGTADKGGLSSDVAGDGMLAFSFSSTPWPLQRGQEFRPFVSH